MKQAVASFNYFSAVLTIKQRIGYVGKKDRKPFMLKAQEDSPQLQRSVC